ncbi:hypothetical protein BD769DRAFT_1420619 [Suillus cothurnatus]|nr:hypothetical protein BD769DRAFT_1420619 [Suillus cothurnatus]
MHCLLVHCCTCCILVFMTHSLCSIGCAAEAPKHHWVTFHAAFINDYLVLNHLAKMRGRSLQSVFMHSQCQLLFNVTMNWYCSELPT